MHPDIAYELARGRIDDLHRDAARRRVARTAAPGTATRSSFLGAWARTRFATAEWVTARTRAAADPACCPA